MGQFSVEKPVLPGSVLTGNQQARRSRPFCSFAAPWQADFLSLWRTVIIGFALSAISTKARPFAAE